MDENHWSSRNISTKEWLKPNVTKDSILFTLQHLGIERMNVLEISTKRLPKRKIYGLISIYDNETLIKNPKPFVQLEKIISPSQLFQTQINENNKHKYLPQNIKNSELSINLINFTLLASTNFGERCGKFLKQFFDDKMKECIENGDDNICSIIPLAFVHNLTSVIYPHNENFQEFYFALDQFNDIITQINYNGEDINITDEGFVMFCHTLEKTGCKKIYAIVDDDSQQLIQRLHNMRKELSEYASLSGLLDDSIVNYLDDPTSFERNHLDDTTMSDLAEMYTASENYLEASDYDLLIEDDGNVKSLSELNQTGNKLEDEDLKQNYLKFINQVSQVKKEFGTLWFQRMDDYELTSHPEFDSFYEFYSKVLDNDTLPITDTSIKEASIAEAEKIMQPNEIEKENIENTIEKSPSRGVKRKCVNETINKKFKSSTKNV